MDASKVAEILRLSPAQEDLLRASLATHSEGVEPGVVAVQYREVDFSDLERAWRHAQQRFPMLRASFHWEGMSNPVQVIWREAPLPVRHLSWDRMDRQSRRKSLQDLAESERRTTLRLDAAPLMRLTFVRRDRGGYAVWAYHPLIADRLSAGLVLEAVQQAWAAYRRGTLPSAEAQDDGVRTLVERIQRGGEEPVMRYWRAQLSGSLSSASVVSRSRESSTDREGLEAPDEASSRDSLRTARLELSAKVAEAVHATAIGLSVEPESLLLAAIAVVSARENVDGAGEVVIGVTVPGRPEALPETSSTVGPFENLVPLKIDCPLEERVGSWTLEIERRRRELEPYQFFPLSRIDEWVAADCAAPWFDIVADLCPSSPRDLRKRRPVTEPGRRRRRAAKVVLAPQLRPSRATIVRLDPEADGLSLRMRYDGERLHWLDADRLLRELESALAAIAERYDRPLGEILKRAEVPTVVPLHPGPGASDDGSSSVPAAYCVHPAGGGVSSYAALAQYLGRNRLVFGLEAPDVSNAGERARVEDLAAEHVRRLVEFQPEGAYVLVGWSFGGLLACEIAHQLSRLAREVTLLVLIDPAFGPDRSDRRRERSLSHSLLDFARQLGWPAPKRAPRRVSVRQLAERLLTQARRAKLAPPGMTPSGLIEQCRSYLRHVSAARVYRPRPYEGPSLAILPDATAERTGPMNAQISLTNDDPTPNIMSWALAEDRCLIDYVKGTHATLLRPPCVEHVAERIDATLQRLPAGQSGMLGRKPIGARAERALREAADT